MLDIKNKSDLEKISEVQRHFLEVFADSRTDGGRGVVQFVSPAILQFQHVRNCRMFVNRHAMLLELADRGARCAEVGVLRGDLSEFMLSRLDPSELLLFDIDFKTYCVAERFARDLQAGRVRLVGGDSSSNLAQIEDGYFDWIYVDGDHTYDGCKRDLDAAIRKIRPDGIIFVNDYLVWSHTECRPYGVVYAVNEICVEHDFEMVGFSLHGGMYCDVAIRRMPASRTASNVDVVGTAAASGVLGNYFEVELARFYRAVLAGGGVAIDGGANSGLHAQGMAHALKAGGGRVIGFEPLADVVDSAQRAAKREGLSGTIQFEGLALGEKEGRATFFRSRKHSAYSSLKKINGNDQYDECTVGLTSIDSYLAGKGCNLADVRFIKLDLEGGEYHAILGARETIVAGKPVICFENARDWAAQVFGYSPEGVIAAFEALNYSVYDFFGVRMTAHSWRDTRAFMFYAVPTGSEAESNLTNIADEFWNDAWRLDVSSWEKTVLQVIHASQA